MLLKYQLEVVLELLADEHGVKLEQDVVVWEMFNSESSISRSKLLKTTQQKQLLINVTFLCICIVYHYFNRKEDINNK